MRAKVVFFYHTTRQKDKEKPARSPQVLGSAGTFLRIGAVSSVNHGLRQRAGKVPKNFCNEVILACGKWQMLGAPRQSGDLMRHLQRLDITCHNNQFCSLGTITIYFLAEAFMQKRQ